MIVPCPACQTRFNVDSNALGEAGRKVRCAKCSKIWHQMPENEANSSFLQTGGEEVEDGAITENLQNYEMNLPSRTMPQSKKETSLDGLAMGKTQTNWAGARLVNWLFLILVLSGLCGGGYFFHVKIVEIWPPAASFFEILGLTPKKANLVIRNVSWAYQIEEGKPILVVVGEVINNSNKRQSVPHLLIVIRDVTNRRLFKSTVAAIEDHLDPGHITNFSSRLANPPVGVKSIIVTLQVQK